MSTVKKYIEQMLGLDKIKEEILDEINQSQQELAKIKEETQVAIEEKNKVTLSPKEIATAKGEPWVSVLDTHISEKNANNGYFELDWNKPFIDFLIENGYGFESDPEEEIVDRWFRTLAYNMLVEADAPITEHTTGGFINLKKISDEHSEVS